jgi:hypothetical protein
MRVVASFQLTISGRTATQDSAAEIFITGAAIGRRSFPVLIIFYVAFCVEPAQAKQNEASKMRVTSPREETG